MGGPDIAHQADVLASGVDRSADESFTRPQPGRPYHGPVYFRGGAEPYVTIAQRAPNGSPDVVVGEVNLTLINDVVAGIAVGDGGYAYAVDSAGVLVAHPDLTLVLGRRDLASRSPVREALAGGERRNGISSRDLDGNRVLASYDKIEPLGWTVFVQQPLDAAFAPVRSEAIRTAGLLAVALLLAAVTGTVLARRMAKPVVALQQSAAQIGAVARDQASRCGTGRRAGELARSSTGYRAFRSPTPGSNKR